jgi:hypothetical protein
MRVEAKTTVQLLRLAAMVWLAPVVSAHRLPPTDSINRTPRNAMMPGDIDNHIVRHVAISSQ